VTMGVAPELGLAELTIEAWVRRNGRGEPATTGAGGLSLVPIAGKGRGEQDGSNLDCNYAFGFWGDVLGADFEDMATGLNHPVTGTTPIPIGEWHHVAATYDGTTWRLYVDGVLDGEQAANATPRHDSIQHFGVGTAFDSAGNPAGRMHGAMDELRVWDHARSEEEIAGAMYVGIAAADGLVGRWALDPATTPDRLADSAGPSEGLVLGGARFDFGVPLDRGVPPAPSDPRPNAEVVAAAGGEVELGLRVVDADGDAPAVTFRVRELGSADDFTIVVLPDTQYYTVESRHLEQYFHDQTAWIVANREDYDIVGVIHNGDIVDHGDTYEYEWIVADAAMSRLEVPAAALADGVPYGVAVGNHDQTPNGASGQTASFNRYFGVSRFAGRAYYGGSYGATNDESWFTFSAGGLDVVVVDLQYDTTPDAAVLAWARSIFEMHPAAFGILNTHYLLDGNGDFGAQGQAIYDALKDVDNVQLMTCGHVSAEARRSDTFEGHTIHTMLADYQSLDNGGGGRMRIWELSPQNGELTVRTYSPSMDLWETDDSSEFTLEVDLSGAAGSFRALAATAPAGDRATARLTGVRPGRTYEWYAVLGDCEHEVRTPTYRFSVAASAEQDRDAPDQPARAEPAERVAHPPVRPRGTAVPIED